MLVIAAGLGQAVLASLGQVVGAVASQRAGVARVLVVAALAALFSATAIAVVFGESTSATGLGSGVLAGLAGGIGVPLAYLALSLGPVGIVSPSIAAATTITVVTGAWWMSGQPTTSTAIGLALCLGAVVVASSQRSHERANLRALALALAAGLSFGSFALLMAQAPGASGLWPLAAARLGVLITALAILAITEIRRRPTFASPARGEIGVRGWTFWLLPVAAGCCDVLANILFLVALVGGDLATVTVVQALSPVATVLIAWPILRQRPTTRHWIAVAISVAALVVVALGTAT